MRTMKQYHVNRAGKRTTITLLPFLNELLIIKIFGIPDEKGAQKKAREWLQKQADCFDDSSGEKLSQWLQKQVIVYIADKEALQTWENWNKEKAEKQPKNPSNHNLDHKP